jgi:hypothetical protein
MPRCDAGEIGLKLGAKCAFGRKSCRQRTRLSHPMKKLAAYST